MPSRTTHTSVIPYQQDNTVVFLCLPSTQRNLFYDVAKVWLGLGTEMTWFGFRETSWFGLE